ncbi:MAG TPA: 1,4-dihydroxy-2-naphthoate polyprenyltransferase, partial [Bacteroidia bacterium]|nr:1,4-dihydroxy-2-naphthoate polyprenyltransferase [Bacteroidia bacterium]
YHAALLITGMMATVVYTLLTDPSIIRWIYLISFAGIIRSIWAVQKNESPEALDPELKKLAISTLLFSLLFGAGLIF